MIKMSTIASESAVYETLFMQTLNDNLVFNCSLNRTITLIFYYCVFTNIYVGENCSHSFIYGAGT